MIRFFGKSGRGNFIYTLLIVLIAVTLMASGCIVVKGYRTPDKQAESFCLDIKARLAHRMVENKTDFPQLIIIDVRTPEERKEGYIEHSLNIDFKSEEFKMQIDQLDKNATYLVYCQGGYRSKKVQLIMKEKGFKKILNMQGGFLAWKAKKYPIAI